MESSHFIGRFVSDRINYCVTDIIGQTHLSTVEFVEREWKFHLGTEFTTTFGRNLGRSNQTCKMLRPNALRCEERHSEHRHWHVFTTFEFYELGILRIHELPYKDNMSITKFYERLFSLEDIAKKPTGG